jgi:hypothetical protein
MKKNVLRRNIPFMNLETLSSTVRIRNKCTRYDSGLLKKEIKKTENV